MMHTPVSASPASIARSTGAAPRQRGSNEKCTFTNPSGTAVKSDSGRICPNATTTPTSAPLAATSSRPPWPLGRAHRQPELQRGHLHRARYEALAPPTTAIGLRDHERDVVPRGVERAEGRNRVVGCAEEGDAHEALSVRRRSGAVLGRAGRRSGVDRHGRSDGPVESASSRLRISRRASRRTSGLDAVEDEHAVEVVDLVLDHAGEEVVALEDDLVAVEVEAAHGHEVGAHDLEAEPGHREAPFAVDLLARHLDDLGVDHHVRAVALVEVVGEEALAHADLRGREPDAFLDLHGLVHAVDERDEVAGDLLDFARGCFSTGSPNSAQRIRGHAPKLPAEPVISDPAGIDVDPQPAHCVGRVDLGQRERVAQPRDSRAPARGRASRRRRARAPCTRLSAIPLSGTPLSAVRREHAARSAAHARDPSTSPLSSARPPKGGKPRAPAARAFRIGDPQRVAIDAPPAPPRARAPGSGAAALPVGTRPEQSGRPHEQPQRLLGRPHPRREQLLVELEECDQADGTVGDHRHPVQHRLGADEHVGGAGISSVAASTAATAARGRSAARSSRTLFTPGRSGAELRAVAVRADLRSFERSSAGRQGLRRARTTVAPQRSQRASSVHCTQARSRARPRRLSTHTERAPSSRTCAQRVGQRSGQQTLPGCVVALGRRPARVATTSAATAPA